MRLKTTIAAGAAGLVLLGAGAASGAIPGIPAVAVVGLLNGSNSGPTEVHNDRCPTQDKWGDRCRDLGVEVHLRSDVRMALPPRHCHRCCQADR
jgi:hypothetical protein